MANFITNSNNKSLKERIKVLIESSKELKFLSGFFYFSGLQELYEGIKENPDLIINILVGIKVDVLNGQLIEMDYSKNLSDDEKLELFFDSIRKAINTEFFDTTVFYQQSKFFINLIKEGRLIIKKTYEPNHAKLYLFYLQKEQVARDSLFITGSSNLTNAGLSTQNEFNVEISDYGFKEAEEYFDKLWENAVVITENEEIKKKLIEIVEQQTLIREVTPFEAYALVLKSYLETFEHKNISSSISELLQKNNYKQYKYQLDAIKQAVAIIEKNNGVLIADVVGLGKTIIACSVARELKSRGMVICPPALIGDGNKTSGWKKYLEQFNLHDWEVRSSGNLQEAFNFIKDKDDMEVVIVDEAHRFRNQDTQNYELLMNICRGRKVILLTATPFNNKPQDILSLLNLFVVPKKSVITLDSNLKDTFSKLDSHFEMISFIKKNYNSLDPTKRQKAKDNYQMLFGDPDIDLKKVKQRANELAKQIRDIIEPVTIRRNRLDLQKNPDYCNEVEELSVVDKPLEGFYDLSPQQSKFYDKVIEEFFADPTDGGKFKGAIYRPFEYEEGIANKTNTIQVDKEKNRELIQQRNLFDIMRRLIVKRFESSFAAFNESIKTFKGVCEHVLQFIEKTGKGDIYKGEYILDRNLLENILELDNDEIEQQLIEYEEEINKGKYPKTHKRYKIEKFKQKDEFIDDIRSDIKLFDDILTELEKLQLVANDPKAQKLYNIVKAELSKTPEPEEPMRKIVIFSEYADTVKHLERKFKIFDPTLSERTLIVYGNIPETKNTEIINNFDASVDNQLDNYDILITTDKLSEGFNLNRAGMVINYDIPWNPVRVIQRLGRINRISKKVFNKIYIMNFFPTEKGAEYVHSRDIAANKMFMIHKTLGEDAKIFDIDEEPTAARLYEKLIQNPDNADEASFYTRVLLCFNEIKKNNPEIISNLKNIPRRIKVIKSANDHAMYVFFKKNRLFVKSVIKTDNGIELEDTSLEETLDKITCQPDTPSLPIDENFWQLYEEAKQNREKRNPGKSPASIESTALNVIDFILMQQSNDELTQLKPFIRTLREDILDYGTLPNYTLRRIANLARKNSQIEMNKAMEEFKKLEIELGHNYLDREKNKNYQDKEIIIAIENRATQNN
jgi:superfamily II DNA or RNA helicase